MTPFVDVHIRNSDVSTDRGQAHPQGPSRPPERGAVAAWVPLGGLGPGIPQPKRKADECRLPLPSRLQAASRKGGALRLHLPFTTAHVRDVVAFEERQSKDCLRNAGTRDDFADDGTVFSRDAGDARGSCHGSRRSAFLGYCCQEPPVVSRRLSILLPFAGLSGARSAGLEPAAF
jgi:hypothetical protein